MPAFAPALPNYFYQWVPIRITKLKQVLEGRLWKDRQDLEVRGGPVIEDPVSIDEVRPDQFKPVLPGETFGPPFGNWNQRWFQIDIPTPSLGQMGQRFLFWDCRGETTVFIDGEPWAGLNVAHEFCPLPDKACTLFLDCGTYQTAIWHPGKPIDQYGLRFDGAWIATRNPETWEVYWDLEVLSQLMESLLKQDGNGEGYKGWGPGPELEKAHPALRRLMIALDNALAAWENGSLNALAPALKTIYAQFPAESWQPTINIFGHSHLDLVWMWPETIGERKAVTTFSTALRLLDEYPEFKFMWTSPANYQALERRYPGLFHQIKDQISKGRWEATGGAWVEFDTLIACGEALARSLVLGQTYFKALRGEYSTTLWLPDCFGFNVCLPQLMNLAGVKNFFTSKLSWNINTKFPYQSFIWRSPDGSQVLTHLDVPGGTDESVNSLVEISKSYRQLGVHDEILKYTGVGDGGGGAMVKSIEMIRRWKNLAGTPKVEWGLVEPFFERLGKVGSKLPVYEGELYLEFHRGIYTTQSEFKRRYRNLERSLQVWEAVRAIFGGGAIPPAFWERLCFSQFHDALPGSSIPLVYDQLGSALDFLGKKAIERAFDDYQKAVDQPAILPAIAIFNPLGINRQVVVDLPLKNEEIKPDLGLATVDGILLPIQVTGEGEYRKVIASLLAEGLSVQKVYKKNSSASADVPAWDISSSVLDNGLLRIEFDERGQLQRITENGTAWPLAEPPHFSLYPDLPPTFDAWEIDQVATRQEIPMFKFTQLEVVESGPVRGILRGGLPLGEGSRMMFDYILEVGSPVLRMDVTVYWREKHAMLKFHLPTLFHGKMARYGAPFGSVQRPQVPGLPHDEAMWEVPGSRWGAVTDDAGWDGLALISEAKYGFSCRDGNLALTLLRSPVDPTLEGADLAAWQTQPIHSTEEGQHTLRFSLSRFHPMSDAAGISTAGQAEALYAPVLVTPVLTHTMATLHAPVILNPGGDLKTLVPSWVLPAQDGNGYILRIHETLGVTGKLVLEFNGPPASVSLVDFLELPLTTDEAIRLDDKHYEVYYHAYQILSILVRKNECIPAMGQSTDLPPAPP